YTEEEIARALVEPEIKAAIRHLELEHRMAEGRHVRLLPLRGHLVDEVRVPGGDDVGLAIRLLLEPFDYPAKLVDLTTVCGRQTPPHATVDRDAVAPLHHEGILRRELLEPRNQFLLRSELFILRPHLIVLPGPLIPDVIVLVDERFDVRGAGEEP